MYASHKDNVNERSRSFILCDSIYIKGGGGRKLSLGRQEADHLAVALAPGSEGRSPVSNAQ